MKIFRWFDISFGAYRVGARPLVGPLPAMQYDKSAVDKEFRSHATSNYSAQILQIILTCLDPSNLSKVSAQAASALNIFAKSLLKNELLILFILMDKMLNIKKNTMF